MAKLQRNGGNRTLIETDSEQLIKTICKFEGKTIRGAGGELASHTVECYLQLARMIHSPYSLLGVKDYWPAPLTMLSHLGYYIHDSVTRLGHLGHSVKALDLFSGSSEVSVMIAHAGAQKIMAVDISH